MNHPTEDSMQALQTPISIELVANEEWKNIELNGFDTLIPIHWEKHTVGEKINFALGNTPSKTGDNYNGDTPWVTIANITNSLTKNYTAKINSEKAKVLPKGSLIGSFKMSVGRFSILAMDAATNEAIVGVPPDGAPGFSFDYLRLYLPKPFLKAAVTNGQGVKLLNTKTIKQLQFISPDIKEQTLIAQTLTTQEAHIASLRDQVALERKRLDWLSDELLSGRLRVEEDPSAPEIVVVRDENGNPTEVLPGVKLLANEEWKSGELNGETVDIPSQWKLSTPKLEKFRIRTGKRDANAHSNEGEYPFFTCSTSQISKIKEYSFDTEALIINGNGEVGAVKYFNGKFDAYQRVYVVDQIENTPFFYFLFNAKFKSSIKSLGAVMPYIKVSSIEDFLMLIPTSVEMKLIEKIINTQEAILSSLNETINLEQKRLDWLSDELLSGRLRIRVKGQE